MESLCAHLLSVKQIQKTSEGKTRHLAPRSVLSSLTDDDEDVSTHYESDLAQLLSLLNECNKVWPHMPATKYRAVK